MKNIDKFIVVFYIISLAGCNKKVPATDADIQSFQKYYSNTKWYFVERRFNPENIDNATIRPISNSIQFFLEFPSGTYIIYTEFEPKKPFTIKSFNGNGTLSVIHDVNKPIFKVTSDYTKRNDCIILNGFVGNKRFQIEAKSFKNQSQEDILRDALDTANFAFKYLSKANNKDIK